MSICCYVRKKEYYILTIMKKLLFVFFFCFILLFPTHVAAQDNTVNLYLFHSRTCPHCHEEIAFLDSIQPDYPYLVVKMYETSEDVMNQRLLSLVGSELGVETRSVPLTIIGNDTTIGFLDPETTGKQLLEHIEYYHTNGDPDVVGELMRQKAQDSMDRLEDLDIATKQYEASSRARKKDPTPMNITIPETITVPLIGAVSLKDLSLPVLTIVIAFLDGFNPCAMWVLVFLISMLLGMQDKRKMWLLGSAFIFVSGLVYFVFLAAWLNVFMILGFISWIRIVVAVFAVGAGVWQLREYMQTKDASCKVVDFKKKVSITKQMKKIISEKNFVMALVGITVLAVGVNMIELVCSAGLPAIYTHMLSLSTLPIWQYYLYLALYILIFMIDDLFVFVVAMKTLQMTGLSTKYVRFSKLIGGLIILIIGILMLVRPEILTFGSI